MYHTRLVVRCDPGFSEMLMAELAEANFDAFLENENGFEAYAEEERYDKSLVEAIRQKYGSTTSIEFTFGKIPKRNWNEEWEKSFAPVVVEDKCLIRAEFHAPGKQYPYEVIITPKMSFGTGHHQTTYLMVKNMLDLDYRNKRVIDAGCGTAILSILASKLGAKEVQAFDIDDWSVKNATENIGINHCRNIRMRQGTINELGLTGKFDNILANINKNVLREEIGTYAGYLHPQGQLLLSGFFSLDIPDLLKEAVRHGLKELGRDERDTWASLLLGTVDKD